MVGYIAIFIVSSSCSWLFTLAFRKFATSRGIVEHPDDRRAHSSIMPTSGGVAMCMAAVVSLGVAYLIPQFRPVFGGSSMPLGLLVGAVLITLVGFVDDVKDVSPPAKVAGQVLAAAALAHFGVTMLFFRVPFAGSFLLSPDLAAFVTVVWIIVIANAINLIDGLDGLAAGITLIAASALFMYGHRRFDVGLLDGPSNLGPLIALITVGICLGFLPHNFSPAKIFMGDAGSMLLGLMLASSAIILSGQTDDPFSGRTFFFFAPVFIPFVILGVPLMDTTLAVIRRTRRRMSISAPDREHLHHRLMELGHGPRRSVLILWLWTAFLSTAVLVPSFTNRGNAAVPFAIAGSGIALYTYFAPGKKKGEGAAPLEWPKSHGGENDPGNDPEPPSYDDSEFRASSPV